MTERRYGEDEVREIFRIATTEAVRDRTLPGESIELTLSELQRIGQEVGIEPSRVAHAAAKLDANLNVAPVKKSFGMPIGLSRVVDLPRAPTDREWALLISEFRSTFGAQGHVTTTGGFREWSQGNLHISVEPSANGQQLRLSSLKDDGIALNLFGAMTAALSVITGAMVAVAGKPPEKALASFGMFAGMALISFGANVIRLPRWARERGGQMEAVAEHAVKMLSNS